MADRPIIFSGPMIRALLREAAAPGTGKTQTRRILTRSSGAFGSAPISFWEHGKIDEAWPDPGLGSGGYIHVPCHVDDDADTRCQLCDEMGWAGTVHRFRPRVRIGDRLWVRETCRAEELSRPPRSRPATRRERQTLGRTSVIECSILDGADGVRYLADDEWIKIENSAPAADAWSELFHYRGRGPDRCGHSVPAIHMPRWASRLTLIVSDVRVQRLQEISDADAIAEGCPGRLGPNPDFPDEWDPAPVEEFRALWDRLHGAGAWADNPWICAISFEVRSANIDAPALADQPREVAHA